MIRPLAALVCVLISANVSAGDRFGYVQAERLEYREHSDSLLWDFQGSYGGDYHRFRWKTDGEFRGSGRDHAELQLLYSRAWSAYFNLQLGIRFADLERDNLSSAVAGIYGVAPYEIKIDAAAFLSEDGDLSIRAEFERDIVLQGHLILQPRAEIGLALNDAPEIGIGSGVSEIALGLRLRIEVTPRFAPYVGVSSSKSLGETADIRRAGGDRGSDTTLLAGVRFWF